MQSIGVGSSELNSGNGVIANCLLLTADIVVSTLVSQCLSQLAVASQTCITSELCRKAISCQRFEGVFVDFSVDDAIAAIDDIRHTPSTRTAVVIAIVANDSQAKQALDKGAHFVVQQPLSRSAVESIVRASYGLMVRERRRYFRCAVDVEMLAHRKTESAWLGRVINVSEGGACIFAPVKLTAGENVELEFKLPPLAIEIGAYSQVQWCTPNGRTGLQFLEFHGESGQELQRWLAAQMDALIPDELTHSKRESAFRLPTQTGRTGFSSTERRPYTKPLLSQLLGTEEVPEKFRSIEAEILGNQPPLMVTVDENHRYVKVSEEFARLLGYSARELLGKRIDDITPQGIIDIEFAFRVSRRFGEMQGLWLFQSRDGKKLLCSYRAKRSSAEYTAELKPLFVAA